MSGTRRDGIDVEDSDEETFLDAFPREAARWFTWTLVVWLLGTVVAGAGRVAVDEIVVLVPGAFVLGALTVRPPEGAVLHGAIVAVVFAVAFALGLAAPTWS